MKLGVGCVWYSWREGERRRWKRGKGIVKGVFGLGAILACGCMFALAFYDGGGEKRATSYTAVLALRGVGIGFGLGVVGAVSREVVKSHYRGDAGVVGLQSGFAGGLGAVLYTSVVRVGFSREHEGWAGLVSGGVMVGTLGVALVLLMPYPASTTDADGKDGRRETRSCVKAAPYLLLPVYILITSLIPVHPLFLPLLLTQTPSLLYPDKATTPLLILLATAALSSSLCGNMRVVKRIGAITIFVAAAGLAGAVVLVAPMAWGNGVVAMVLAAVYGIGLGAVVVVNAMVWEIYLGKRDRGLRRLILGIIEGVVAAGAIVGAAAVLEGRENGVRVWGKILGALLIGGGVLGWGWEWMGHVYG